MTTTTTTRALIVCGAGASSGLIAQRMRKAAQERGIDLQVDARSETELPQLMSTVDVVLVGPHLSYMLADLQKQCDTVGIEAVLLPQEVYGQLDGERALDLALDHAIYEEDDA